MERTYFRSALACSLLLASGLATAQLTIYKQPNFSGGEYTLNKSMPDLKGTGFYDQASSAVVRSGRWEVCTQPEFRGECVVLEPGRHARLDDRVFHRVESVRELRDVARQEPAFRPQDRYAENRYEPRTDERFRDQRYSPVEAFTLPGFRGFKMDFDRDSDTLNPQFQDEGINSLIVREGRWQLCSEPGFNGYCRTFEPGRYPRVGNLRDLPAGSLRRIG
jgi:hypothetical protein